jgi:endoglucanase
MRGLTVALALLALGCTDLAPMSPSRPESGGERPNDGSGGNEASPDAHEGPIDAAAPPSEIGGGASSPGDDASDAPAGGYVHAAAEKLLDRAGQPLLLRTAALGNWLLNEGYALGFYSERGDRSRRIEARVEELVGAEDARTFWRAYRDNYTTEDDIARIAELGFNSVRVALNARLLLPEGQGQFDDVEFGYLDDVVAWGSHHGVYVIFDMHGAPGGQTGRNIDDDANDEPELFTHSENQDRLVRLWTEIARRFAGAAWVAGYDLLNEPLPGQYFARYYGQLWPLYQRIGHAIRAVDIHHLLIVEGGDWANDWSTLGPPFDDNMAYSFHKYWNGSDVGSIQGYLDHRDSWKRPIWCGEIGENDDDWYRANFKLLEDNDVGWCFWPWKKLDSGNNPYSVDPPSDWGAIQAYVDDQAVKPSPAAAKATLDALVAAVRLPACRYNRDVVCSLEPVVARQPGCGL